ncbi:MAG: SseB family protein [Pikeienuella sp.]
MNETPLDRAWTRAAAPEAGDAEMAAYYEIFAAAELFLAIEPGSLEAEAQTPLLFPVEGAETALVFDTEARLADFIGEGAAHLALSGRAVIAMFAGGGAQLGVNLGEAPSAAILPAAAVDWAARALDQPIEIETAARRTLSPPRDAGAALLARIDARLAAIGPALEEAWLCGAEGGLLLVVALADPAAERAIVAALAETARFAGDDGAAFDIAVMRPGEPGLESVRKVGFGFEIAAPAASVSVASAGPGMDPAQPPKLR